MVDGGSEKKHYVKEDLFLPDYDMQLKSSYFPKAE